MLLHFLIHQDQVNAYSWLAYLLTWNCTVPWSWYAVSYTSVQYHICRCASQGLVHGSYVKIKQAGVKHQNQGILFEVKLVMLKMKITWFHLPRRHAYNICKLVIDSKPSRIPECVRLHFWVIYAAHRLLKGIMLGVGWKLNFETSWTLYPVYFDFDIPVCISSMKVPDFVKDLGPSWNWLGCQDGSED